MFCFDSNYLFYEEMYINQILLRMGAGYGKIPKILNTFSYRFFFFVFLFFFCFFFCFSSRKHSYIILTILNPIFIF